MLPPPLFKGSTRISQTWPDFRSLAGTDHGSSPESVALWLVATWFFYTVDSERVTIVRVIDGRMDVDEEFFR